MNRSHQDNFDRPETKKGKFKGHDTDFSYINSQDRPAPKKSMLKIFKLTICKNLDLPVMNCYRSDI